MMNHTVKEIATSELYSRFRDVDKFIEFCKACPRYGNVWTCPPHSNSAEVEQFEQYQRAIMVSTVIEVPLNLQNIKHTNKESYQNSYSILREQRPLVDNKLLEIEAAYPQSTAFFAGSCFWCADDKCQKQQNRPCIFPERARRSIEAIGFDVSGVIANLFEQEIVWGVDGYLPKYFTLVSAIFTDNQELSVEIVEEAISSL